MVGSFWEKLNFHQNLKTCHLIDYLKRIPSVKWEDVCYSMSEWRGMRCKALGMRSSRNSSLWGLHRRGAPDHDGVGWMKLVHGGVSWGNLRTLIDTWRVYPALHSTNQCGTIGGGLIGQEDLYSSCNVNVFCVHSVCTKSYRDGILVTNISLCTPRKYLNTQTYENIFMSETFRLERIALCRKWNFAQRRALVSSPLELSAGRLAPVYLKLSPHSP